MFIINTAVKETIGSYFFTHSLSPWMMISMVPCSLVRGWGIKKGAGDERNERQKSYYILVAKEYPDHTFGRKRTVSGLDSNASSS